MEQRKTSEIIFRDDLYPRINHDSNLVQRYAANIDVLPPIEINQNNILIDGWHRWTAHRKIEAEYINVNITETKSELSLYALAIERNSAHGLQLSETDKEETAKRLFNSGNGYDKPEIARILSVSTRTVSSYLHEVEKARKEQQRRQIFDMWMQCYTQDDIAAAVGVTKETVSQYAELCQKMEMLPKSDKLSAMFEDDFNPPLYTQWSFSSKTNNVSHPGNSEQRILENLLYLYTQPFDIILDPFGGGGSTIDVCKKRLRRYWISDRKPIVEREKEIRKLDICQDLPPLNKRWSEVTLTYLDPPYWKQVEGDYSKDSEDLANMPIEEFTEKAAGVVNRISEKQSKGVIAMLMQPTQWRAPDKKVIDHNIDIIKLINNKKLRLEYRISCPYPTQQCTPQQVIWAKENKQLLVITRELIIWSIND